MIPLVVAVLGLTAVGVAAYVVQTDGDEQDPRIYGTVDELGLFEPATGLTLETGGIAASTTPTTSDDGLSVVIDGVTVDCENVETFIGDLVAEHEAAGTHPTEETYQALACLEEVCWNAEATAQARELVALYAPDWVAWFDTAVSVQAFFEDNFGACG